MAGIYKFIIYCVHNCTNEEKGHRNLHKNLLDKRTTYLKKNCFDEGIDGWIESLPFFVIKANSFEAP